MEVNSEKILQLKLELKKWEYQFKKDNGRPPGKTDIKKCPEIAEKYKIYQKSKQSLSSFGGRSSDSHNDNKLKVDHSKHEKTRSSSLNKQRLSNQKGFDSPSNSSSQVATPLKKKNTEEITTPISRSSALFNVTEVGPTPQVHGQVLGLFDLKPYSPFSSSLGLMPENSSVSENRPISGNHKTSLNQDDCPAIPKTPTALKNQMSGMHSSNTNTPSSSSLDDFYTSENLITPKYIHNPTLSLSSLKYLETPNDKSTESSIWLENSKDTLFKDVRITSHTTIGLSPIGPRKIRRGLSNIIAEMRKEGDDLKVQESTINLDNQIGSENGDLNGIEDFDHLGETRENDNEIDMSNTSRPIYKKKGQKRTTKRHIFRPDNESNNESNIEIDSTKVSKQRIPQNFKRLKLHNSGFKGRPQFFKKR